MIGWIASRAGMIWACVAAFLGIVWMLLTGARKAGRDAARVETQQRTMEARDAADRADAGFRADGAERRLRDGTF